MKKRTQVILMCGVSGSGKTTAALRLAEEGYERVSADAIVWEGYGETYASLSNEHRHEIYMQAMKESGERLEKLLKKGCKVVVDSSMCKRAGRDRMGDICRRNGADYSICYLTASEEELWHRIRSRQGDGPDDQRVSREDLDRFMTGFEPPQSDELHLLTKPIE